MKNSNATAVALKLALALHVHDFYLIDQPQKHHGAACSARLRPFGASFPDMR